MGTAVADASLRHFRETGNKPGFVIPTGNLGNALARQGDFERAIAAYDATLAQQPEHADAQFNKALVQKLLEDQQAQQQDPSQSDQSQGDRSDSDSSSGNEPQPAEPEPPEERGAEESDQSNTDGESEPEEGEPGDQEQLADSRDAQQDALEQWLRRVPDDPGGLLRRKFRYETNQRLRRGEYQERR